jgi:hypothetical protein
LRSQQKMFAAVHKSESGTTGLTCQATEQFVLITEQFVLILVIAFVGTMNPSSGDSPHYRIDLHQSADLPRERPHRKRRRVTKPAIDSPRGSNGKPYAADRSRLVRFSNAKTHAFKRLSLEVTYANCEGPCVRDPRGA